MLAYYLYPFVPNQKCREYTRDELMKPEIVEELFDYCQILEAYITKKGWSFLIEYLPTEQPVIHLRNPKATDYMASCKLAMESYYKVWNIKELDKCLNEILIKKIDSKKQERISVLEQLKIKNNNATDKIMLELKNIYEIQ